MVVMVVLHCVAMAVRAVRTEMTRTMEMCKWYELPGGKINVYYDRGVKSHLLESGNDRAK